MTAARRRYTKATKAVAVLASEASTVAAAAAAQGIPESTIRYWLADPKFAELRAKSQQERADGYRVLSLVAQERLIALVPGMEPRDLITLMGVAADKAQLLGGHATSRTEMKDITEVLEDHEREALRKAIDTELAKVPA